MTIRGLTFRNSMVAGENDGGAIYADSASDRTSIIDCSFTNCITRHGGAIRFNAANVRLEGCNFTDCHAWTTTTSYEVRDSLYAYNWRPLWVPSVRFENCTVVSNTCGIYFGEKDSPVLVNCYIGGNTNPPTRFNNYRGNANFGYYETGWDNTTSSFVFDFHATNCVIEGAHILEQRTTSKTFDLFDYEPSGTCEAITDLVAAKGPGFVDAPHGDWRLQRKSPLRDAGALLPWMADGATDLDGNPRLTDRFGKAFASSALPDLGCYECQARTPRNTTILLQ